MHANYVRNPWHFTVDDHTVIYQHLPYWSISSENVFFDYEYVDLIDDLAKDVVEYGLPGNNDANEVKKQINSIFEDTIAEEIEIRMKGPRFTIGDDLWDLGWEFISLEVMAKHTSNLYSLEKITITDLNNDIKEFVSDVVKNIVIRVIIMLFVIGVAIEIIAALVASVLGIPAA